MFFVDVQFHDRGTVIPNADNGVSPTFNAFAITRGGKFVADSRPLDEEIKPSILVLMLDKAGEEAAHPTRPDGGRKDRDLADLLDRALGDSTAPFALGLDLGTKTIGTALCDAGWRFASPARTVQRTRLAADLDQLRAIAGANMIAGIVLGMPWNMDGTAGPRAQATRAFARECPRTFHRLHRRL